MNNEKFIDVIRTEVIESSLTSVESNLKELSGRSPQQKLIEMHEWFTKLKSEDKLMLKKVIQESIETCAFGFLCILDGVRPIEDGENKGVLELYYVKGEEKILINNPNENYLHEILS